MPPPAREVLLNKEFNTRYDIRHTIIPSRAGLKKLKKSATMDPAAQDSIPIQFIPLTGYQLFGSPLPISQ